MNNYVIIKITNFISKAISKLIRSNINLYNIDYLDDDNILVKIDFNNYKKVKKLVYFSKVKIIKYDGKEGIRKHFKQNIYIYILAFFCFVLMDICTSFIVKINIIHENSTIRKLVKEELSELGVNKYTLALDFFELEKIKNNILNNNRTKLEWLSITRVGMSYVVRIEERIITDITKEDGFRHIVSSKDALITKIMSNKGAVLVRSGDYVKKGDILISGEVKLYEEVKGNTLATGEVYGNVWYKSDISFPLYYEKKTYTDNKRFNIRINDKVLFKNKYQYFDENKVKKLNIFNFKISFYNEEEYIIKKGTYDAATAEKKALEKLKEEFGIKLNQKGKVISQKVLKKEQNNSTMNISVFVVTNELISTTLYYDIGSDLIDTPNSD